MAIEQTFSDAVAEILVEWTQELIDDMRRDLESQTTSKRRQLAQSIVPKYFVNAAGTGVAVELMDYYDYVDKGVRGVQSGPSSPYSYKNIRPSKAHVDAIADWITQSAINFTGRGKGNWQQARQSMAYAIATNIKKRGLKAKPFFDSNITDARVNKLVTMIQEKLGLVIELQLLS